ncbi:Transcription factor grauzone [Lucilia cuprina]|nr:Transcription factor grauzone [Lucilia cuprina]
MQSTEWKEWNIQRIIEKHLWWWYLRPASSNEAEQWICLQCWQNLSTFHNFYKKVEKEHKLYYTLLLHIKSDTDQEVIQDIKVEDQHFENGSSTLEENPVHIVKPKRGRKKKTVYVTESIQLEELNIVEVKSENIIHDTAEELASEEICFSNHSADNTPEEDDLKDFKGDDKHVPSEKLKRKSQTKSKIINKCRKEKIKAIKKEKKEKVVKNENNSRNKNDEFLANSDFVLSCSICNDILDSFYNLKIHFRDKHNTVAYAMCCNKKFYRRDVLVDHLNVHKDPNYFKCPKCGKTVTTRYSLTKHMENHQLHETQQNLFNCDKCDKSFLKKIVFERHVLLHIPEEERKFQCSMCVKKFATEYLRKQHINHTHSKKYTKICDVCGVTVWDKYSFNRHMAQHNGVKPVKFKCDICAAELTNIYFLNRHKKLMHTVQQEQICPHCSKISPNYVAHKTHIKYAHTLERKHACHMCDKKFRRPKELKEHLSTHTGEPLYTCPYCPRTFISNANMYKHLRLKHEKEWEKRRIKRDAKSLACKEFLKTVVSQQSESCGYEEIVQLESSDVVKNLTELNMEFESICCKSNEDIFSRITTVSSEWKEWNIQRIIEKHLWWWYLRPATSNGVEQWICRQCWQELSTFHNFYNKVEKEQRLYDRFLISNIKTDNENISSSVDIKVEEQNFENEASILTENLMHLEKPKRGRKKKSVDKTESLNIEELAVVKVKSENDLNDNTVDEVPAVAEVNVNALVADEVTSIDWEHCFINDSAADDTDEEDYELKESEDDDKLNILLKTRASRKGPTKTKTVTKFRKKYTKSKKEKKVKVVKITNSNVSEAMKKNDEFLADNNFVLSCSICSATLGTFYKLKNHFRKEHDILGYAMCCNKKFYKRGVLVDHINVHKDPNYFKCLQCDKALSTRRSYEKHMETHQLYESQQNLFTCDKCDKSFLKKAVFDRHVLTHVPEEERNFQCSMCDKRFASEYLRKQHASLTHSKKYAKICDMCGKLLRDSFSFIRHMAEHNGETPAKVKCDICGAELTNKYRLNRHKKMMHTEENQQEQICPYCSKISPNLNAHKHHVKYAHTLERKHACHMCDKKFRRPLELKEHLSTHTGEPLYTCPHCPRTFISSANMHKHRKLTHRKEWEEGKMKREAKALAGKQFLKSVIASQSETPYTGISIMEPVGNETVPNLTVMNF